MENNSVSSSNKPTSVFSLTLDDFQTKSGRSVGSISIDEFLNRVWGEGNEDSLDLKQIEATNDENRAPAILPRQGSFSIPSPLGSKTLGEIWSQINTDEAQHPTLDLSISTHDGTFSQETLKHITLEDFLVKSGVVRKNPMFPPCPQQRRLENFQNRGVHFSSNKIPGLDSNVRKGPMMGYQFSNDHSNNVGNFFLDNGSSMYQMFTQGGWTLEGEPCDNIEKGNSSDVAEPSNKRKTRIDSVEVAVECRERRMLKNRESAARSRARKQAYTMELEIEQNKLKEENTMLKFNLEVLNQQSAKAQRMEKKFKTMWRTSSL